MKITQKQKHIFKIEDIKPYFIYWFYPIEYFAIVLTNPKEYNKNGLIFCEVWFSDEQKIIRVFVDGLISSLNTNNNIRWIE